MGNDGTLPAPTTPPPTLRPSADPEVTQRPTTPGPAPKVHLQLEVPSNWPESRGARYELQRQIGLGGMGKVFLARDWDLGREVALKVVEGAAWQQERFRHEARVTAGLEHPNIVAVYGAGIVGDRLYLSTRRAQGRSLGQLIRDARVAEAREVLPVNDLVILFLKLCDAVAYAHSRGVIHRDIKPDNIVVGAYGEVTLIDWGAATQAEEWQPSHFAGTPHFMSPEQAQGCAPTPADDLYALGATLFYALLQRRPLTLSTAQPEFWLRKQAGEIDPPTPAEAARFPRALLDLVLRALAANPAQRYGSAVELARDLASFQAGRSEWGSAEFVERFDASYAERWAVIRGGFEVHATGLQSKGESGPCVLALRQRKAGAVAIEIEAETLPGLPVRELGAFWTDQPVFAVDPPSLEMPRPLFVGGTESTPYRFFTIKAGAMANLCSGIFRDGGFPLVKRPVQLEAGRRHHVRIEIEEHWLRLFLDGEAICEHREHSPLASGYVGIMTFEAGLCIRSWTLRTKGIPGRLSPIVLGDEAYQEGRWLEALELYQRVHASHADSQLGDEALYKQALCLVNLGRRAEALAIWSQLKDPVYATYGELHVLDVEFEANRHGVVCDGIRSLLARRPWEERAIVGYWVTCVQALMRTHALSIQPYLTLHAECLTDATDTDPIVADALCAFARGEEVLRDYPHLPDQVAQALMVLGRFEECLTRFGHVSWIEALCLVFLGRAAEVPSGASLRYVACSYLGLLTEDYPEAEYQIRRGEPERVLELPRAEVDAYFVAVALRHLGRYEEAAAIEPAWTRFVEWRLDEVERLATHPRDLRWLRHARAYEAWRRGEHDEYLRLRRELATAPWSHLWLFVPTLECVFHPMLRGLGGDRGGMNEELARVAVEQAHTFAQILHYFAAYLSGAIDETTFLAQPTQLGLVARHAVARGVLAELDGEPAAARRWYEVYLDLPPHQRGFDWCDVNPVIERFVRDRLEG